MDKERLIQSLWLDKKGKSDGPAPFGLYVAIDNPRPNLADLTDSVLSVLAASEVSGRWSATWGRVVICVSPTGNPECNLNYVDEPRSKRFIPIQTTQILNTEKLKKLVSPVPQGGFATVVLNNQPTTIEGFLISYIHMVDELIWEVYRATPRRYQEVVQLVRQEGFALSLGSEDEILSAKMANPSVAVRLYGSKVNKSVPRVMGGVFFKEQT